MLSHWWICEKQKWIGIGTPTTVSCHYNYLNPRLQLPSEDQFLILNHHQMVISSSSIVTCNRCERIKIIDSHLLDRWSWWIRRIEKAPSCQWVSLVLSGLWWPTIQWREGRVRSNSIGFSFHCCSFNTTQFNEWSWMAGRNCRRPKNNNVDFCSSDNPVSGPLFF